MGWEKRSKSIANGDGATNRNDPHGFGDGDGFVAGTGFDGEGAIGGDGTDTLRQGVMGKRDRAKLERRPAEIEVDPDGSKKPTAVEGTPLATTTIENAVLGALSITDG